MGRPRAVRAFPARQGARGLPGALTGLLRQRGAFDRAVAGSRSPRTITRARASHVLGLLETPDALESLSRLVSDRDPDVRTVAARGLGRIGRDGSARALIGALGSDRAVPPRIVAQALLRLGEVANPALIEAARDPRPTVAATAIDVLGLGAAIAASPVLAELVGPGHDTEIRIRSARALGRIGMPSALPGLLSATEAGEEPILRRVAARALGDLGSRGAVDALAALLSDPDVRVAAAAAESLTRLGPLGAAALAAAADAGGRPGEHARAAIAEADLVRQRAGASRPGIPVG